MMGSSVRAAALSLIVLAPFAMAEAGTVHGTVKNGTTGKSAEGVEVILLQLQGGMQPVANSKSDARGEFTFDHPGLGTQPMLIRAVYRGINFHQPVPRGASAVEVSIFEASKDPKTIDVPTHVVIFQPNGSTLMVGEEYSVENKSMPPQAYFRADGNFDFALPEKAQLQQVAASGPAGMPVVQAPIDKSNNRYSIAYAFRPGASTVRYSYEIPYPGNAATVKIPTVHSGGRLLVAAPPTVEISGDGLAGAGQEQGMNLYVRDHLSVGTLWAISVSGAGPPPDARGGGDQRQPGREAPQGGGEAGSASIQQIPGRLDVLKWPLIAGFLCVFLLLALLLARKPVAREAGPVTSDQAAPRLQPKRFKTEADSAPGARPATTSSNGSSSLAEVDAAIGTSLDALKERLFRLELRRQAGTISEEEYAQERARAEKVLRDLVRG